MLAEEQAVKVAQDFGFKYEIVAGCIVTTPLVNGIDSYNAVTTNYLNNKLGKNWKKQFDSQVDSLFHLMKK